MAMTGGTAKLVKTGTLNYGSSSATVKLYAYYKTSQDEETNKSTITCGMYITVTSGWDVGSWTDFNGSYIGTTSNTFNGTISAGTAGTKWLAENKTFTVTHNDDGTGKATIYWKWGVNSPWGQMVNPSGSFTITLPTIARASTITSASDITLGNNFSIKWTPASSSFKYKLQFLLGNWSYTTGFITPNQTSAYTYTYDSDNCYDSICAELPSATEGTITAKLITHNSSGTAIGSSSSKTFKVTIPSSEAPSLGSISLDPVNITTADGTSRNILVQNKNKITVSVSGSTAGSGSDIKSYTFAVLSGSTVIATTTTTSASTSFGPFTKTGSLKFRVTVTDKRSRSVSNSGNEPTWTCYEYEPPTFSSFTAYRCNSSGSEDDNGEYVKYSLKVSYSSVNSTNKSTVKIFYKKNTGGSWSTGANALTDSTTKSVSDIIKDSSGIMLAFSLSSTYSIYATVIDNYNGSVDSSTITIFSAERIFNIRSNGTGVAFGKLAESDNLLESKWPIKVDDEIIFGKGTQGRLYSNTNSDGRNIIYIQTGQEVEGGATMGLTVHNASVYVENSLNSGKVNLGSSGRKWNQLYATNGTINTSDRNEKKDIENMSDTQEKLFNKLNPVTYKFINGTSNRTHYGFISQDVEDSLNELGLQGTDFAGFCKDIRVDDDGIEILDENGKNIYDYSLRYSEFIALNTYMIQKLQAEIVELKAEIKELKGTTQN